MSAVPLPALVTAGTSDLPSSVAFIFSAKAGPAKAAVAPNASVASTVLVFDMVLSLLASSDVVVFKTMPFRFYSRNRPKRPKFFQAVYGWHSGHTGHKVQGDSDGPVNAATNSSSCRCCRCRWLCDLLVANESGGAPVDFAPRLYPEPGQRPQDIHCRRVFLLPCRAWPARSLKARRRPCHPIAVRDVLRSEYLA